MYSNIHRLMAEVLSRDVWHLTVGMLQDAALTCLMNTCLMNTNNFIKAAERVFLLIVISGSSI